MHGGNYYTGTIIWQTLIPDSLLEYGENNKKQKQSQDG
jgi:hypothetical protein